MKWYKGRITGRDLRLISNYPSFCRKHLGVPDTSDGSDRSSYSLTENYMLLVAQVMGCVAYLAPSLCAWNERSHCILISFTLGQECCDVYPPSERHVCYTPGRGCSYAEALYTTHGDVSAFLRPIATCRTLIYN